MSRIFNPDNALFRFLSRVADLMILNLVFLITCIPIVTIGAALTGMSYVTRQMAEGEESYIIKGYLKSFRQNFKQATVMWLIVFALGLVLGLDIYIVYHIEGMLGNVSKILIFIVTIFYLMEFVFLFPVLARFDNTTRNTFKNAFIMAIADFPRTLLMIAIMAAAVVVTFLNAYTLWYGILAWLCIGFAAISISHSYIIVKVFAKYMPKDETTDPDAWTVEEVPENQSEESGSDN